MRNVLIAVAAAVTLVSQVSGQAPATPPKVQISFEPGGLVTLSATNATVRDVLAEWTRQGGTPFVGAERLTGTPQTLLYEHRPATEVIASLLRNASGYVIGPTREAAPGTSDIPVVYILATSTPTSAAYTPPAPAYVPQRPLISTPGNPADEIPPVGPGAPPSDATPATAPRPAGSGVAVPVVPVVPVSTPPPGGQGRGGGSGRGGGGGR